MLELNKYSSKDDRRTWTTNASRATQIQKERESFDNSSNLNHNIDTIELKGIILQKMVERHGKRRESLSLTILILFIV